MSLVFPSMFPVNSEHSKCSFTCLTLSLIVIDLVSKSVLPQVAISVWILWWPITRSRLHSRWKQRTLSYASISFTMLHYVELACKKSMNDELRIRILFKGVIVIEIWILRAKWAIEPHVLHVLGISVHCDGESMWLRRWGVQSVRSPKSWE